MADQLRTVVRKNLQVLEAGDGHTYALPGGSGTIRFIADKHVAPFALIHSRGGPDVPVVPHYHRKAIDTWLVLKGKIKNWAGDEGRVLCSGDFGFVPNKVVHSFEVIEPHTEYLGVIHPSEWIEFFREIMEHWDGPGAYPDKGPGEMNPFKFMKALADGHDVVPRPNHEFPPALHEWTDCEIPTEPRPYWIKAHRNKRYALGGQTLSPLANHAVSNGLFSMAWIEGSKTMPQREEYAFQHHDDQCFVFYITDGSFKLTVGSEDAIILQSGDSVYIPPGEKFSLHAAAHFSRALATSDGPGLEPLFVTRGKEICGVLGDGYVDWTQKALDDPATKALAEATEKFSLNV